MWNGRNKAVTFSFDDGITQDKDVIKILNKYGLKATFNLNSAVLGFKGALNRETCCAPYNHITANEIKEVYKGHEIAVHTLVHPLLTDLSDEAVIWQIEGDRILLERFYGHDITCMAYPGGGTDKRIIELIKNNTPIKIARGVCSSHNFDLQDELLDFKPTAHWEEECVFDLIEEFLSLKTDKPQVLYIWGHAYELDFDGKITIEKFEEMCQKLCNKDDVFYGTNSEVLLKK